VKNRRKKNRSLFRRIISATLKMFFFFFLFSLIISLSAQFIPPGYIIFPAFFGLAFPYLFIINVLIFAIAIFRKYKFVVIVFVPILFYSSFIFARYYQLGLSNKEQSAQIKPLKVMSFNVRVFNLYFWNENKQMRDSIMSFIEAENPDILCLQEYYEDDTGSFETFSILTNRLGYKNHHRYFPIINNRKYRFGIATFSRFPIVDKKQIIFDGSTNMTLLSEIDVGERVISVFNCHLESIRLSTEDINFISDISISDRDETVSRTLGIFKRLRIAFRKRQTQADIINEYIRELQTPVIICGDFNDTPASYSYRRIRGKLNDSFINSGRGSGSTYISRIPAFRIDYIFYSNDFKSHNTTIHKNELSDHYSISTNLIFANNIYEKK